MGRKPKVKDESKDGHRSIDAIAHFVVDWAFTKLAWVPGVLAPVATGIASLLFALTAIPDLAASTRLALFVWGGIASFISISSAAAVEWGRRKANSRRTQEAAELQLALTDAFHPIQRHLTSMVGRPSAQRKTHREKVVSAVLMARPVLFKDNDALRMVVYELRPGVRNRARHMAVLDSAGRPRDVPQSFKSGDGGRGDAAFEWVELRTPKFVPDTELEADPHWKGSGIGYRTFISVPIFSRDKIYGMLTVDSPAPGDLDETDVPLVVALADFLSMAFVSAAH